MPDWQPITDAQRDGRCVVSELLSDLTELRDNYAWLAKLPEVEHKRVYSAFVSKLDRLLLRHAASLRALAVPSDDGRG